MEIWGLEKFTAFDAYGDGPDKRHYGTVWTNPNGNAVGVVGPAVLHWKQKWKTDTAPEKTTVQCLVNSMRWNGATIALAAFKGTVDKTSKMKSLTQRLYLPLHDVMLHAHVADWVRDLGDLRPYASHGLEHAHSIRKLIARHLTNRHKHAKVRKDGKMGKARTEQCLSTVTARKEMMRQGGHALQQREDAANTKARRATQARRIAKEKEKGRVKVVADF